VDKVRPFDPASLEGFADEEPQVGRKRPGITRLREFWLRLAPWQVFPPVFRDPNKFPYNSALGEFVHEGFLIPWKHLYLDPETLADPGPRDLLLRGRFDKAAGELTTADGRWRERRAIRAEAENLDQAVDDWVSKAIAAYAAQLRAKERGAPDARADQAVEQVMKEQEPVVILLQGAAAGPLLADLSYQLGLCKQEKAERLQARLDRKGRADNTPEEVAEAEAAWREALSWWKKFADEPAPPEDPRRPATHPGRAAAARQMRGRALAALGDWRAAAEVWEDVSDPMPPLEKVAARYKARQVRQEHGGAKDK
jgi:hypothetical protein